MLHFLSPLISFGLSPGQPNTLILSLCPGSNHEGTFSLGPDCKKGRDHDGMETAMEASVTSIKTPAMASQSPEDA